MRIGILSDVHDNVWALEEALRALQGVDALLGLGDYCAAFSVAAIAQGFAGPIHLIWGNNDGDKLAISRATALYEHVTIHGDWARLELGGRRVAMVHYPELGQTLAEGGRFDLVCHGHNHQRAIATIGQTLLVNPGEVMGRSGVHSVAIYDTETRQAESIAF